MFVRSSFRPWSFMKKISVPSLLVVASWAAGPQVAQAQQTRAQAGTGVAKLSTYALLNYAVSREIIPKLREHVDQAITRFQNRDVEGARSLLETARQQHPQIPPTEILLGKMFLATNQKASARTILENFISKQPDDPEPYLLFAIEALNDRRMTDAELLFQRAATATKSYQGNTKLKRYFLLLTFNGLATMAERREDWKEAVLHLQAWAQEDPDQFLIHRRLGRSLFLAGQPKPAYEEFVKAKQVDSKQPNAFVSIARLYSQQGKTQDAKKFIDRAIKEDGDSPNTRLAAAQWLLETDDYAKAKQHLDVVLRGDPGMADALFQRGLLARMENDHKAAEKFLSLAHLQAPSSLAVNDQLAHVLMSQSEPEKRRMGTGFAALNARLFPQSAQAQVTLGWVYYQLGRGNEAQKTINASLNLGGMNPDSRYILATIYVDSGRNAEAVRFLQTALNSPGVFVNRRAAQALLDKINS